MLLLLSGVGLISSLMVLQSFDSFSQKEYLAARIHAIEELQKSEYSFYLQAQEHMHEMSVIRHDFNDQLQTIRYLISEGTREASLQAEGLIDEVHNRLVQTRRMRFCENEAANAVFCVNAEKAKEEKIEFQVYAEIPQDILIRPIDLCGVFSNLISNAMEACIVLEDNRTITVAVCQKNE